ncbi:MAG: Coq4 family protein [Leptolyngbyaceae cyanobacterium bins.302]|nr:Coq4 family protein [Leptolyngbyaceae cyanobacterium bins.302]
MKTTTSQTMNIPAISQLQDETRSQTNPHWAIDLKGLLQTLKGTKAFVTMLFDDSGSLTPVEELSTSLVDSPAFQLAVEQMKTSPDIAELIAERYMAPPHHLDALLQLPTNSLGYVYASSMKQAGFQPLMAPVAIESDTSYVENRWQQTHDIWHIVTGFDTSEIGEIGLQAFYLAQFQLPLASLLIANALISATVLQPEALSPLLAAIAQGWEMGRNAKPFIAQKWEEAWEKPLAEWRSELNVETLDSLLPSES